ncbi:hypothetical protein [Pelagibacterium montanilacus]|uniref:hypothetical protein n=1 Tax=Pelagibacterium montanilacus TaxID=2185280 RepID=UPI000F8EE938|nr:hypothetical protein [Pelagibacterium montanilacus]
MNHNHKALLARIKETERAKGVRSAAEKCLDVARQFADRAAKIKADENLTQAGKAKALHDEAVKTYLPALNAAQAPIGVAVDSITSQRRDVSVPAPDPANIAAALERQEIRAMVREMTGGQRMGYLIGNKDERILDAVLTAPAALSGLNDDEFIKIHDATLERRHGQIISELREAEDSIASANAAHKVALNEIKAEVGVSARQFDGMLKSSSLTPWLMRQGADIVRVIPGESKYPHATADEIAAGKFYASQHEYETDNPGAHLVRPDTQ